MNNCPVKVESIIPKRGYVGQKTLVVLKKEKKSIEYLATAELNSDDFSLETISGDSIYFTVPYLSEFKDFYLFANDSENDSTYKIRIDIDPYPESCGNSLCIKWNNVEKVADTIQQSNEYWEAKIIGDTVKLIYTKSYPDLIYHRTVIFKNNGSNYLPEFISLYDEDDHGHKDTLETGLAKIDKWDLSGAISGIIYSEKWESKLKHPAYTFHSSYGFYYTFSK